MSWTPPEGWDSSEATAESYGDFDRGGYRDPETGEKVGDSTLTYTIDQYGEAYKEDNKIMAPEGWSMGEESTNALRNLVSQGYGGFNVGGSSPGDAEEEQAQNGGSGGGGGGGGSAPEVPSLPDFVPGSSGMGGSFMTGGGGGGGGGLPLTALIAGLGVVLALVIGGRDD